MSIEFVSTPHERSKNESIKSVPQTEEEFYKIVNDAPWTELKTYGFRKWDKMNNLIQENIDIQARDESSMISIPIIHPEDLDDGIDNACINSSESMIIDLGNRSKYPTQLLEHDEDVILFPKEWYNIIPDQFKCTSLYGEEYIFQKGKSDDDTRFGCLAYGIRRLVDPKI